MLFYAQNQSFSYEYKFVKDSTEGNKIETELMVLNVFSKGSQFYSKPLAEADSVREAEVEKQIKEGNTNIDLTKLALKGKIKHMVEKSYPDYHVNTFVKLGSDEYIVEDSRKQDWKISPEKEKVGEFVAQKSDLQLCRQNLDCLVYNRDSNTRRSL
ncbi:GLPGLI family protein [Chryseobacterium sp. 3008163]|uniref:GLPGLI family protein n=1 Tax=Chryseobacterium sp. 3008163 TaxID=2478663 RepID=UPI0021CE67CC|nr:GLPGLI family protein [Chryseobacterium sp. 3008163]